MVSAVAVIAAAGALAVVMFFGGACLAVLFVVWSWRHWRRFLDGRQYERERADRERFARRWK